MSEDIREAILVRLLAVAKGVAGIKYAERNAINISENELPAIVIIDGEEEVDSAALDRNVPGKIFMPVHMTPLANIMIAEKTANAGTVLNGFRVALIKAVLFDIQLLSIVGEGGGRFGGGIRYVGATPGLSEGRLLQGSLIPRFRFSYIFDPNAL